MRLCFPSSAHGRNKDVCAGEGKERRAALVMPCLERICFQGSVSWVTGKIENCWGGGGGGGDGGFCPWTKYCPTNYLLVSPHY